MQLEMFSLGKNNKDNVSYFEQGYIKKHERAVLFIFFLMIACISAYCFGVYQGRKPFLANDSLVKDSKPIDNVIATGEKSPALLTEKEISLEKKKKEEPASLENRIQKLPQKPVEKNNRSGYAIQIATYRSPAYAEKEAKRLKNKGFNTLLLNKGDYILLCVGTFFKRQEAEMVLAHLKKQYGDCFIRRF